MRYIIGTSWVSVRSQIKSTFIYIIASHLPGLANSSKLCSQYDDVWNDIITRQIWGIWKLRPAYSPETPNLGQNRYVSSRVTLKFDGWPWKTIGHLFFAVSSFVQHSIAIGEFKLELQSGNAQFESNSTIFRAIWPWNLTDDLEKQ